MQEILDFLKTFPPEQTVGSIITAVEGLTAHDVCRYCGKPIAAVSGGSWHHEDRSHSRGCRAASFDPNKEGDAWDDSIPRKWMAAPAK